MAAPKPDKTKKIVVNLDRQVVVLYQSGEAILTFDCVSGDEDHPTPEGHFTVPQKYAAICARSSALRQK
jgi:hypothetical protein